MKYIYLSEEVPDPFKTSVRHLTKFKPYKVIDLIHPMTYVFSTQNGVVKTILFRTGHLKKILIGKHLSILHLTTLNPMRLSE